MTNSAKFFELLDFTKFGAPSVAKIDADQTAISLIERLFGEGFMSYNSIWSRMGTIVDGHASDSFILSIFNFYKDEWKNSTLREVVHLLKDRFGGRGTWYPVRSKPMFVLGFWFKPSIKGIWFVDGQAYAVLINPRKTQKLSRDDARFLARGVYELYCVDDPNDPIPLIIDLSEHRKGEGRIFREYKFSKQDMISLEDFESSIREFLKALRIAGVAVPDNAGDVVNLLKRKHPK